MSAIQLCFVRKFLITSLVFCLAFLPLAAQQPKAALSAGSSASLDQAALEEYLRYLNLWNSDVQVAFDPPKPSSSLPGYLDLRVTASVPGASLVQDYYVSPDGARLIRARASDRLGKTVFRTDTYPFQAEQEALNLEGRPSLGPEHAPITLAVFSDFQCAFCRDEAKLLRSNLSTAYPDAVRLVFVDFPLMQIHNWAKPAAIAGHCIAAQDNDSFWAYHDWVFDAQPSIRQDNFDQKLGEWLPATGIDVLKLQQCRTSPEADESVMASFQQALSLGLNSTPTLFVNGRQLGGKLEWAALKQVIETELGYIRKQESQQSASKEECCSVELPGVFPK
jgi:protein-disulfide isomerase